MLKSSKRKLALSGWLKKNDSELYNDPIKLQYFLFLYEAFSKVFDESCEFDGYTENCDISK